MITHRVLAPLTLLIIFTHSSLRAEEEEPTKPVPQALALKLGPDKLTAHTSGSESGQDRAAQLYATAKRIDTEHKLAQKDVTLVVYLNDWRDGITKCRQGVFSLAYTYHGGGTMYSHAGARDGAAMEDFLAALAPRLPLPDDDESSPKALKKIDANIAFLKKLNLENAGSDVATPEAKERFAVEVQEVISHWEQLRYLIGAIPAADAIKVVDFASKSLEWLRQ